MLECRTTQLIKEDINLAKKYRYKSVAEKHSIRLAWERLMDVDYRELRKCLCPNQMDMKQFSELRSQHSNGDRHCR